MHRFVLFFSFVHEFQNANWFFIILSSEAYHVLTLLIFLGKSSRESVVLQSVFL